MQLVHGSTCTPVPGSWFRCVRKKCNFFIPKLFLTNTTAYITEHTKLLQGMLVCIVCLCLEQKVFFSFQIRTQQCGTHVAMSAGGKKTVPPDNWALVRLLKFHTQTALFKFSLISYWFREYNSYPADWCNFHPYSSASFFSPPRSNPFKSRAISNCTKPSDVPVVFAREKSWPCTLMTNSKSENSQKA